MRSATLRSRLEQLRKMAGVPRRELDRLARLGEGHTTMIVLGKRKSVEAATASALASVLGVSLDWLVNGEGDPPSAAVVRAAVRAARQRNAAA